MAIQDRSVLKEYFQTGDVPTESQFADLIDSMLNFKDDGYPPLVKFQQYANNPTSGTSPEVLSSPYLIPGGLLSADGQCLRVSAIFQCNANLNEKAVGMTVGADTPLVFASSTNGQAASCFMQGYVIRTGANTGRYIITALWGDTAQDINDGTVAEVTGTGSYTWASTVPISVYAQTADAAGDLTLVSWNVEYLRQPI